MDKQQKQLIIIGVLVVVLALALVSNLKKKPKKKAAPLPKPDAASLAKSAPVVSAAPAADAGVLGEQIERTKLTWGRDPFSVNTDKTFQLSELKLQGISFGTDKKGFAFINGEIVQKGDKIGDYEVIDIEKERVLLKRGSQDFYLVFPGE